MKKYLLPPDGNFYKANLHCHTTCSDGKLTPEEVKELYKSMGYSVVAYTDHDILLDRSHLTDDDFLPLNGFEVEINSAVPGEHSCCHICAVALDRDNLIQPCWNEDYLFANAPKYANQVKFDAAKPKYIRRYTPECISEMMQTFRDSGFFVTYNHPTWSNENYKQYSAYSGMHAMEMVNYGCVVYGYEDYNPRVYDDMLKCGKKIYAIATDDNHNAFPPENPKCDSGGGFTMIKAPSLAYADITNALLKGNFYASEGPEISELYIDGENLTVKCSPAQEIYLTSPSFYRQSVFADENGLLTSATFRVIPDWNKTDEFNYFRLTITDEKGNHATTNAYFIEDLFDIEKMKNS